MIRKAPLFRIAQFELGSLEHFLGTPDNIGSLLRDGDRLVIETADPRNQSYIVCNTFSSASSLSSCHGAEPIKPSTLTLVPDQPKI